MKKWLTTTAVLLGLSAAGLLVYWQWDPIWSFVLSPVGGIALKILFTTKALKVVAGVLIAAGAGFAAWRKKRNGTPEPEHAPPVYGPPVEEPTPGAGLTAAGTETATTAEPVTARPG